MTLQGGSSNMELKLKQFKDTLIKAVNEAELPLSLVSYVMNCLMPQNTVKTNDKFADIISGINSRKLCIIY